MRNEERTDENKITRHLSQNWQMSFALRLIRNLGDLWVINRRSVGAARILSLRFP